MAGRSGRLIHQRRQTPRNKILTKCRPAAILLGVSAGEASPTAEGAKRRIARAKAPAPRPNGALQGRRGVENLRKTLISLRRVHESRRKQPFPKFFRRQAVGIN
jgi:hypothetical protein